MHTSANRNASQTDTNIDADLDKNVDANEVSVVKLGEVIIKVINSALGTKHYSGQLLSNNMSIRTASIVQNTYADNSGS